MSATRALRLGAITAAVAILATCGDATAPTTATRIDVVPPVVRVRTGQSIQLAATARDETGATVAGVSFAYGSDDPGVASVSSSGRVSGGATGTTTITVTGGGASARVPVRVGGVPATIEVTPAAPEIVQGTAVALVVTVRDSSGEVVPDEPVAYATNDGTVATVTPAGVVTGIAGGPAIITVTALPATAVVPVAVLGRPAGTDVTARPMTGRPYGVAVSRSSVVYVTRLDAGLMTRIDLPVIAFSGHVAVGSYPTDVAFDPTGTRAYVTNQGSQNVGVVNVATNAQIDVIPVGASPFQVLVSPDGARLYVTTNANDLLVFNLPSTTLHVRYQFAAASAGLAFHPNGVLLYGTTIGGLIYEINTATDSGRAVSTTGHLQDIAVSRDGAELYIANETGAMEVRSTTTLARLALVPVATGAYGLRLTPDGTQLYAGIAFGGEVRVIDRASRTLVRTISIGTDPRRIAFDRYGRTAVITEQNGEVYFVR
jgi:YVTN family beta-propeller protein